MTGNCKVDDDKPIPNTCGALCYPINEDEEDMCQGIYRDTSNNVTWTNKFSLIKDLVNSDNYCCMTPLNVNISSQTFQNEDNIVDAYCEITGDNTKLTGKAGKIGNSGNISNVKVVFASSSGEKSSDDDFKEANSTIQDNISTICTNLDKSLFKTSPPSSPPSPPPPPPPPPSPYIYNF